MPNAVESNPVFANRLIGAIAALSCFVASIAAAAPPPATIGFLRDNCMDCHEGDSAEAGFDLRKIGTDLEHPAVLDNWVKVVDRVRAGEMPPKEAGDVDKKVVSAFTKEASNWVRSYQLREHAALGRVRGRRLTNLQLENTLQDLFAVDIPLADLMPEEQRTDGFTNIAEGQSMSHFQLANHLVVVDAALDAAFERAATTEAPFKKTFNAKQLCRTRQNRRCREPEFLNGKAVTWNGGPIFYGRLPMMTAKKSSWYRFTIKASAMKSPKDHGVWCSVRTGRCTSGAPLLKWVGAFEATDQPKEMTYVAWLPARHMLEVRPADATLKKGKFAGGQVGAGEGGKQNVSGLALHSMTVQEIFPGGDVAKVRERLFGKDVKVAVDKSGQISVGYEDATKGAAKQLRSFGRRAFRRNISEEQLQPYLKLLRTTIAGGGSPADALRAAYRAILCSPRFMYFSENPGILDDYAIATRLSYMIYNSTPDWKLLELAKNGKLRDRETICDEVERMLKTRRGREFVASFTDQWLDMVDISFTEPDRKLHRDFDVVVQNSMLRETRTYVQKMLDNNAPISGLVKSDHTYLDSRLARFYDIDGVKSDQMQRVSLTSDSHRGGLLAQGAVLKVTANGTNTSPVLRGVWIADRIMGEHIPPPPENVPAIEPDIRGAKSIRDMLAKHRDNDACASCHRKIDPNGFALENFDAAGQWRERYPSRKGKSKGLPVDPSYRLSDGRPFKSFDQFRDLVASKPWPLARNFAEKLLVYGTGAPIAFSDRGELAKIVEQTKDDRYGARSLLKAVVTSRIFLSK